MLRVTLYVILAVAAFGGPAAAAADTLIIDRLVESRPSAMQRPARGMSRDKVESKWGAPLSKRDAVGDPPISRWEYADFVVYFEYNHVIHAVQKP